MTALFIRQMTLDIPARQGRDDHERLARLVLAGLAAAPPRARRAVAAMGVTVDDADDTDLLARRILEDLLRQLDAPG
jgi:hypothetical protein